MSDPIVIYPLGNGSKWGNDEIKHSLRSIHQYWNGRKDVFLLCSEFPKFLNQDCENLHIINAPGYAECIEMAIELAKKHSPTGDFLWMNDDIFLLNPCGPKDFEVARRYEKRMEPGKVRKTGNNWWKKLDRVRDQCDEMGISPIYNFSTHTPYLYNADKLEMVIAAFGLLYKTPLETAYYNFWAHEIPSMVMRDKLTFYQDKAMPYDIRKLLILNVSDNGLSGRIRGYIRGLFPRPSPYERLWQKNAKSAKRAAGAK
tara:strand:- start:14987 stop:15757 length:771 start_codon:yes stop_codon:yes gene_type:complete